MAELFTPAAFLTSEWLPSFLGVISLSTSEFLGDVGSCVEASSGPFDESFRSPFFPFDLQSRSSSSTSWITNQFDRNFSERA